MLIQQKDETDTKQEEPVSLETHPPNFHEFLAWLRRRTIKMLNE